MEISGISILVWHCEVDERSKQMTDACELLGRHCKVDGKVLKEYKGAIYEKVTKIRKSSYIYEQAYLPN